MRKYLPTYARTNTRPTMRAHTRPTWLLLRTLFTLTLTLCPIPNARAATVSVDLQAPWPTHPLSPISETAEFLHTISPDLFWKYLDHVAQTPLNITDTHDRSQAFQAAMAAAAAMLNDTDGYVSSAVGAMLQLLKISLEFRAYAPAVEQQRRLSAAATSFVLTQLGVSVSAPPDAWVLVELPGRMEYVTSVEQLRELSAEVSGACANTVPLLEEQLAVFPFDHQKVVNRDGDVVITLIGVVGSRAFERLFGEAMKVECGKVVVRLVSGWGEDEVREQGEGGVEPTFLQGFGATLDIKNMEYITVDENQRKEGKDRVSVEEEEGEGGEEKTVESVVKGVNFDVLKERFEDKSAELDKIREELRKEEETEALDAAGDAGKLKVWEMAKLGLQVTQRIMESSKPLETFEDIVGNFPLRAPRLSKLKVSSKLKRAAKEAAAVVQAPAGVVYLNGIALNVGQESFNIFSALDTIKKEVMLANDLRAVGLHSTDALEKFASVLTGDSVESDDKEPTPDLGLRVDVRKGGKGAIFFLNNIEKDGRYSGWPTQVQMLLQGARQIVPIRKNMYTMIVVLDPLQQDHRSALNSLLYFIEIGVPVRIGIVFARVQSEEAPSSELCDDACFTKLYLRAKRESSGKAGTIQLLQALVSVDEPVITKEKAVEVYAASIAKASGSWTKSSFASNAREALDSPEGLDTVQKMHEYTSNKGLTVPSWSLNGLVKGSIANIDREFTQVVFEEQRNLMVEVWYGNVKDKTDVLKYILSKANAVPRYNPLILQPKAKQTFAKIPYVESELARVEYLKNNLDARTSLWVIVDLFSPAGKLLVRNAMAFSEEADESTRVALFPQNDASLRAWNMVFSADPDALNQTLESLCPEEVRITAGDLPDLPLASLAMSMCKTDSCVVANGRVLQISKDTLFGIDEFKMLVASEEKERVTKVDELLRTSSSKVSGDLVLSASSLAGIVLSQQRQFVDTSGFPEGMSELTLTLTGGKDSFLSVKTILNPLTAEAQKIASVLRLLHERFQCKVEVILVPEVSVSDFPLQNFYRFSGVEDKEEPVLYPSVEFDGMPRSQLLTLKVFTPEYWIVYPLDTGEVDTDNIRLETEGDVHASFVLKSLLVTGHAHEKDTRAPPAGMQLELYSAGSAKTTPDDDKAGLYSDTLVMNNLGYFQLQANPGVWRMQLAEGPSRSIYQVSEDHSVGKDYERIVLLRDFSGNVEDLEVNKRPGKEEMQLLESLDENSADSGIWTKVASKLFDQKDTEEKDETIHVFSLASGALYERFIRIMMVSVASATKSPLKFWIIENFLSPRFKKTIGKLAEAYGFDYALVTYRWPYWLHGQTEKQRIIWGYKILFLDVLFPLNLRKVIYVDADQVVRADLKELWDMDLKGRPYGYTPFCDSRKETLGFQFWRSGYWKDHLRGRPYHISALYVVDLVVFRKMAVGDRLRAIYDSLSRDPNSLSNLDQDLPNYAQNMVPIFSLPQEWLWCESWCSDTSKKTAKTIDLCNNPLHKEPKLDMAKRVISGPLFKKSWVELDEEIEKIISVDV